MSQKCDVCGNFHEQPSDCYAPEFRNVVKHIIGDDYSDFDERMVRWWAGHADRPTRQWFHRLIMATPLWPAGRACSGHASYYLTIIRGKAANYAVISSHNDETQQLEELSAAVEAAVACCEHEGELGHDLGFHDQLGPFRTEGEAVREWRYCFPETSLIDNSMSGDLEARYPGLPSDA